MEWLGKETATEMKRWDWDWLRELDWDKELNVEKRQDWDRLERMG